MPSNAPPSPFPFLPVVLESPVGAQGRARAAPPPDGAAHAPETASRRLPRGATDASRGKGRAACRRHAGAMQDVPGLSPGDEGATLRAEVVRRIDPARVALLGAIVR